MQIMTPPKFAILADGGDWSILKWQPTSKFYLRYATAREFSEAKDIVAALEAAANG